MKTLLVTLLVLASFPAELTAQSRSWTRLDGAQVEAQLIDVTKGDAMLALTGGRRYPVPIEQLSLLDLRYLAEWVAERDFPDFGKKLEAAKSETLTAAGRELRIEAEEIQNPQANRPPDWNPKLYLIEADGSRGFLELKFPNPLFDSDLEKVKSLELIVYSDSGGKAGTTQPIRLVRGREVLATRKGAPRDQELRFTLDPERFRNRAKIDFEMHCGPDAIVLVSDPAPVLIAVFE